MYVQPIQAFLKLVFIPFNRVRLNLSFVIPTTSVSGANSKIMRTARATETQSDDTSADNYHGSSK